MICETNLIQKLLFINPLALELDIYILEHHVGKMWIFYEPKKVTWSNTWHFQDEQTEIVWASIKKSLNIFID